MGKDSAEVQRHRAVSAGNVEGIGDFCRVGGGEGEVVGCPGVGL